MEGNFPGIFPTGVENWFEFAGVSNNRELEKSGVKLNYSVTMKEIQGKRRLVRVIGRFEKPRVREIGILL